MTLEQERECIDILEDTCTIRARGADVARTHRASHADRARNLLRELKPDSTFCSICRSYHGEEIKHASE